MANTHIFKDEWLVETLKEKGLIKEDLIDDLRDKNYTFISQSLINLGTLESTMLGHVIQENFKIGMVEPKPEDIDTKALSLIPDKVCKKHHLLPLKLRGDFIDLAMVSPLDITALDDIRSLTGRRPAPSFCLPEKMAALLSSIYEKDPVVYDLIEEFSNDEPVQILQEVIANDENITSDNIRPPIVKLVNSIIAGAVRRQSSDIHIEHEIHLSHVRYRTDGFLHTIMSLPKKIARGAVVARIKIMANLDISIHHRPQDGRAKLRVGDQEVGLRISIMPTNFGEKVVIRILDRRAAEVPFKKLGFQSAMSAKIKSYLTAPQGVILVTGPTGCGKTTTLYSILHELKSDTVNITTIEDPIEYSLEGINQIQVNEKHGLTFPSVLRSVLRQDPDIIMIGEIRDQETAAIAFQAALTGHLVLTTLHTNDTLSSLTRLVDMGVERFKIAPGLIAILAQRLVRRLCQKCRKQEPSSLLSGEIQGFMDNLGYEPQHFTAVGCPDCFGLGYRGRLAILELLEINPLTRELISSDMDINSLRTEVLNKKTLFTIEADALWHVTQGDTSLDEVLPHINHLKPGSFSIENSIASRSVPGNRENMPESNNGKKPAHILVVDGDPGIRSSIRTLLEKEGYGTEDCTNGISAIELIESQKIDLLLVDRDIKNKSGIQVLNYLRQDSDFSTLPIIVMTNQADEAVQAETLRLGADDFVVKPINQSLLLERIKAVLRRTACSGDMATSNTPAL